MVLKVDFEEIAMGKGVYPTLAVGVRIESPEPFQVVELLSCVCTIETAFNEESMIFLGYAPIRDYPQIAEHALVAFDIELDGRKLATIEELRDGGDLWLRLGGGMKYAVRYEPTEFGYDKTKVVRDTFVVRQFGQARIRVEKEEWENYLSFLALKRTVLLDTDTITKLDKVRPMINPEYEDRDIINELLEMYLKKKI
ncbi:hypothetical protein DRN98_01105 [Methanosarcinales archaeon]|nr:MAG: hypothetical protein DRN98_01105 [Methanosarcinales archaeon]